MAAVSGLTAEQLVAAAAALRARGRSADAEPLYRAALGLQPDHFASLHALGAICLQKSTPEQAMPLLLKALQINPDSADAHNDLGIALAGLGRFSEAAAEYEKALTLAPGLASACRNLGNALAALGKPDEAIARFEQALALEPDSADTHNDLGVALASTQRHAEAILHFERSIKLDPAFASGYNNLGNTLVAEKRVKQAIAHFEKAIALRPDYALAEFNLGNALSERERHEEAVEHFRRALAVRPDWVAAHCGMGFSLHMSDRSEQGLACYQHALGLNPASAETHHGIGLTLQALGRLKESRVAFDKALELAPGVAGYHRAVAEIRRFSAGDPQLAAMEALAADMPSLPEAQQAELHFALGKAYGDLDRHEISFRHLIDGNAIKHRLEDYDEAAHLPMMRHIQSVFTAEVLGRHPASGDPSDVPVFILGMPRSGSTLVEQILASHPKVFGAGELRYMAEVTRVFRGKDVSAFFPEVAKSISGEQLRAFGAHYVERVRPRAPEAARITDKMPSNFRFIGFIRMALPNARIIHTRRDPLDTCISCFSRLFGKKSFTSDLGTLGRYYRSYETLMAHWRDILPPGAMLEVQYEDLVADFENQARRIVDYCGIEWDANCLDFHRTTRAVRTASVTQVREPIFTGSIGRWQRYEPWLGPLLDALKSD
jgi:tetratricopeptide (TPR) repeat protein